MTTAATFSSRPVLNGDIKIPMLVSPSIPPITASTPSAIEQEYTDEQFHADLKKASKHIKAMAAEASKEYAEGKTEIFPK